MLLALVVASANCRHLEVRKEVLSFACEVISNITFLNPLNNSNIFLLGDISSTNSGYLPHLILQLRNSFEHFKGETYKPAQKKTLEANILAIAHIWTFETGKSDIEITLNSFNKLLADSLKPVDSKKAVSIDGDGHAKTSMVYFLASITSSSLLKDFSATLSYFKARQEAAKSASISARREVGDLAEKNKKLENKIKNHKSEVQERDALIEDLKQQLTALTEQSSESELSLKAQKVHLKDDTSKAKAKALNFLEEELLSTLQSSLKALDRETPKVHIAVHNIDVMIERVEEELEWFKK
ncbi:hypothetical protein AB4238_03455 [Shewanella sp. 10N.286.45.A1]|uniref:hypothetical protein n=1 Tax=Shewanella sp. 10N.286.45.A1 TaxID=3229694 RepID=UPI003553D62F